MSRNYLYIHCVHELLVLFLQKNFKRRPSDNAFLLSLTHVMVDKALFLGQIFEMEILMDLHVMRAVESKNHIFSVCSVCMFVSLCVCLCACVSVCVSVCTSVCVCVITTTQKQIAAETLNLVFYICIIN